MTEDVMYRSKISSDQKRFFNPDRAYTPFHFSQTITLKFLVLGFGHLELWVF